MGDELGRAGGIEGAVNGAERQDEFWGGRSANDKNSAVSITQDNGDNFRNVCS